MPHVNNVRAMRAFRKHWNSEDRTAKFEILTPIPGTRATNPMFGPSATDGIRVTTLDRGLGGWFTDRFTPDGYRIKADKSGRAIYLAEMYTLPTEDGAGQKLNVEALRKMLSASGVKTTFNGIAVTVTHVDWDEYAQAVVIDFDKVP